MTNKYDNLRLNVILDRISNHDILTKAADVICRMRENLDCLDFIYIPADSIQHEFFIYLLSRSGYLPCLLKRHHVIGIECLTLI